jgi:NADH:ubiquinone oxidoreductase subunit H
MIAVVFAITSISVIPFGNFTVGPWGTYLQITDVNIGLLVVLGITSMGVYGVALAGWSSNNKYSLLGGLRASAQMISYEVSLGLSLVGVLIMAGSFSLRDIVDAQGGVFWGFIPQVEYFSRADMAFFLSDFGVCGDEPHAFRSAGSGVGTGGWISHRIQRHEICDVFHGGVRQHGDGRVPGDAALFGRLARADFWPSHSCRR